MGIEIRAFGHAGIRVTSRERSRAFYAQLGFDEVAWYEGPRVAILRNVAGIELNLVVNATGADADAPSPDGFAGRNVLMDLDQKYPGYTHVAFLVDSVDRVMHQLAEAGLAISEGPVALGEGYRALFVRDPDRNVVELGEKLP